jgi:hypothetical protein
MNATATGEVLTFEEPAADLARLDWFPRDLAWRFRQATIKASTAAFAKHLDWAMRNGRGPAATCRKFDEYEMNEIAVFAGEYRAQCGTVYPHIAADASIQRYGELGASRHPPRRIGKPVMRRGGKRRKRAILMSGPSSASLY